MAKSIADSTLKLREVIYVVSAVCWFLFQYFSLTQKIDAIASSQLAYKELTDFRVNQLEQNKGKASNFSFPQTSNQAILPKQITLEDEK